MDGGSPLVDVLREALEPQEGVRLAVLYGSLARGDEDAGSDLDLLVSLAGDRNSHADRYRLATELERLSGRRVDIARLERVESTAPLLLHYALQEGRVLVDRDGQWRVLGERRDEIGERARSDYRRQMAAAGRALDELTRSSSRP